MPSEDVGARCEKNRVKSLSWNGSYQGRLPSAKRFKQGRIAGMGGYKG